jgi:membrane protein required for colicin V production
VALLSQVAFIREKMQKLTKDSFTYPLLVKIGEKIINITPQDLEKLGKNVKISYLKQTKDSVYV